MVVILFCRWKLLEPTNYFSSNKCEQWPLRISSSNFFRCNQMFSCKSKTFGYECFFCLFFLLLLYCIRFIGRYQHLLDKYKKPSVLAMDQKQTDEWIKLVTNHQYLLYVWCRFRCNHFYYCSGFDLCIFFFFSFRPKKNAIKILDVSLSRTSNIRHKETKKTK